MKKNSAMGVYIHIPFCVRKCDYCDFLSGPAGVEEQLCYMEALREEIRTVSELGVNANLTELSGDPSGQSVSRIPACARTVDTVFFGGGTPSILPAEEIAKTLETVRSCFCVAEDAEITVECNPGTLTEEKCRIYRACGVNRLSIGLQSADNRLLKNIGRIHTFEEFLESYEAARRAGFSNINIDLMSGLPGQGVQDHVDTLYRVLALKPQHISAYSLILEEGTPLYERIAEQNNPGGAAFGLPGEGKNREETFPELLPSEDEEMEMYVKTREILEAHGYRRYEISNYSLPGKECRHNLRYWNLHDYCGFGIGAASFADGCRCKNTDDRRRYVHILQSLRETLPSQESSQLPQWQLLQQSSGSVQQGKSFPLCQPSSENRREKNGAMDIISGLRAEFARETDRELMEEFLFLGLRKVEGIDPDEFADRFGLKFDAVYGPVKEKLIAQGFLKETGGENAGKKRICLTDRGIDFSNEVLAEFLL